MLRNVRNTNMPMDTFVKKVTELNLYLVLLPLDGQSVPKLEKPYHSCLPTLSIRHLCQAHAILLDPCALVLEYLQRDIICFLHILEMK
ncbi:Putative E3 ubiquitin-protein ligase RING1a [Zea mays]|uniref:Putative E3 ubiquitin-protein ligase RING1a n=1 Tax=Zea mays TaxID=4577 RepID=A0A1D6J7L1_MAIZE|nr:Putative E3 ubiquitin-protein ligase RING1a [Zea mays]